MGKAKLNIPMFAALILLLLTMITTHMTSGLYARYTDSATGSDSVRVAKFEVTCDVVKGEGDTYILTVHNASEVTVKYSIEVTMDPHLSVTLGEDTKRLEEGKTSVTFENDSWELKPETDSEKRTLKLAVADWRALTDPNEAKTTEHVALNFSVNVLAEQVD